MSAEVFTQSRADRDAELVAHDQLSREAVELRAEVERLRAEYARATSSRDEYMNLHLEGSDALIEMCGRVDAAEAEVERVRAEADVEAERGDAMYDRAKSAEARLRKVEALADRWRRYGVFPLTIKHASDLRAALAETHG